MKNKLWFIFVAFLIITSQAFAANFCSDIVVDEAGVMNSNQFAQVSDAAKKLKANGVDVRVDIVSDLHGQKSLKALKDHFLDTCSNWRVQNTDGTIGMKRDLFVIMIAMKPGKLQLFYGDGLKLKLEPHDPSIRSNIGAKLPGDVAGGLITGLNDVIGLMQVRPAHEGAQQINIEADGSWKAAFLWGLLAVGLLILGGWFAIRVLREKERRRNAQNQAKMEKSRCVAVINDFEGLHAIILSLVKQSNVSDSKKSELIEDAASAKNLFGRASSHYSIINRDTNPDIPNLSVIEYEDIAKYYSQIADKLESAIEVLNRIEHDIKKPEVADKKPQTRKFGPDGCFEIGNIYPKSHTASRKTSKSPPTAASVPRAQDAANSEPAVIHETTVVHHDNGSDLLTGVLIGQAMGHNEHHHHHYDGDRDRGGNHETPFRQDSPAPASMGETGGETNFSFSSRGNSEEETNLNTSSRGNSGGEISFGDTPSDPEPETESSSSDSSLSDDNN